MRRRDRAVGGVLVAWSAVLFGGGTGTAWVASDLAQRNSAPCGAGLCIQLPEIQHGYTAASVLMFGGAIISVSVGGWLLHRSGRAVDGDRHGNGG